MKQLTSTQDASVNFVVPASVGYYESRFVQRTPDYFITYLSSQSGCSRGCRFCHLTTTKQTQLVNASAEDYVKQAIHVFGYAQTKGVTAATVNYNFMARGEPFENINLMTDIDVFRELEDLAHEHNRAPRFNISTIIPNDFLSSTVLTAAPNIYYSLYSMNEAWRRKWLPNALPVLDAIRLLKAYQNFTGKEVTIHHPFIEDENDSDANTLEMVNELDRVGLRWRFNLVRYNPPNNLSRESHRIQRLLDLIRLHSKATSARMIDRVGFDVKASCGMFVTKAELEAV